jgi:hypothetical protein
MSPFYTLLVINKSHFIKQAGIIVSLFCFGLFYACEQETILAKVGKTRLTQKDAMLMMKELGYNVRNKKNWKLFIDQWCEQQVFKQELEQTNPSQARLITMRSEAFESELAKYYLVEQAANKQLDTSISNTEMHNYFNQHREEFTLQDYLVKALYLKIPVKNNVEPKVKQVYLLKNSGDLSKISSLAKLYAENYYFDDEKWIYFNDLVKDIPLNSFNKDNIVLNRTKTYFSDDNYTYFLNVIDYKLKNSVPPFEFIKEEIRELILSERVNNLKEQITEQLIRKIKQKHEINIYF